MSRNSILRTAKSLVLPILTMCYSLTSCKQADFEPKNLKQTGQTVDAVDVLSLRQMSGASGTNYFLYNSRGNFSGGIVAGRYATEAYNTTGILNPELATQGLAMGTIFEETDPKNAEVEITITQNAEETANICNGTTTANNTANITIKYLDKPMGTNADDGSYVEIAEVKQKTNDQAALYAQRNYAEKHDLYRQNKQVIYGNRIKGDKALDDLTAAGYYMSYYDNKDSNVFPVNLNSYLQQKEHQPNEFNRFFSSYHR